MPELSLERSESTDSSITVAAYKQEHAEYAPRTPDRLKRHGSWETPGMSSMAHFESRIMSGYLVKKAIKSGRNWRRRYFELDIKLSRLRYWSSKEVK